MPDFKLTPAQHRIAEILNLANSTAVAALEDAESPSKEDLFTALIAFAAATFAAAACLLTDSVAPGEDPMKVADRAVFGMRDA